MKFLFILILALAGVARWPETECLEMEGPSFRLEPPPWLEFTNSSGATVSCSATGSPPPTISWLDTLDSPVGPIPRLRQVLENGSIYLEPFAAEELREDVHETSYRCVASSPAGTIISRECKLKPEILSEVSFSVDNEYTEEGNVGVLRCRTEVRGERREDEARSSVRGWLRQEPSGRRAPVIPQAKYVMTGRQIHVRAVTPEDARASFFCEASRPLTGLTTISSPGRIFLSEGAPPSAPRIRYFSEPTQGRAGSSVDLICVAQSTPPPVYRWFKEKDGILEDTESESGSMRVRSMETVLRFSRLQPEDAGQYVCVASNGLGEDRKQVELRVFSPLSVTLRPSYQVVDGGASVRLNCTVEGGSGPPNIAWLKDGKPLLDKAEIRSLGEAASLLLVSNVRRADAGMYQCLARTSYETEQSSAQVLLRSLKPTMVTTFTEETVEPGTRVSLWCRASGLPPPRVTWLLDGAPIPPGGGYLHGSALHGLQGDVLSFLNITAARPHHGGHYSCTAANSYGQATYSAPLNVYGPPSARGPLNITGVFGRDVQLNCPVGGYPRLTVNWEHHGERLARRHSQLPNGTLLLKQVDIPGDEGEYTCLVQGHHSATATGRVHLRIMKPPEIQEFQFPRSLQEGHRAHVSCTVTSGDLPMEISWLKEGAPLPRDPALQVQHHQFVSALYFSRLAAHHSGRYTCLARNQAAQANFTSLLVVNVPPSWLTEPKDTTVLYNHQATIHCQASGYPTPKITWKYTKISNPDVVKVLTKTDSIWIGTNGSLIIRSAEESHRGHYTCEVENGIGTSLSKTVSLKVTVPAFFRIHSATYNGVAGEPMRLSCEAEGDLPLHISWSDAPRLPLPPPQTRYTQSGAISEVELESLTKHHAGQYYCTTSNDYGTDTMLVNLIVSEVPEAVRKVEVYESGSRWVNLRWERPDSGDLSIRSYLVQFREAAGGAGGGGWSNLTVGGEMDSTRLGTLLPNTLYQLRVSAVNKVGHGQPSAVITFSTLQEAPSFAPDDVTVEASEPETLLIKWKPIKAELEAKDILGFQIFYYQLPGNVKNVKTIRGVEHHSAKLTKLKYFTKYEVFVRVFNHIGHGPHSTSVVSTTMEGVPGAGPGEVRCTAISGESVRLKWEPPPQELHNGVILGYKISYRKIIMKYHTFGVPGEAREKKSTNLEVSIHGLSPHSNYSFRLLAFTSSGDGTPSPTVYCKTEEDVPGHPDSVKALVVTSDSILISWTPPREPNGIITKYNVYIQHPRSETGKEVLLRNTSLRYEWRRLKEYQEYEFWVTASTSRGEGSKSLKVSQIPESRAPAKIASFSSKKLAGEGSRVSFECYAVGLPAPVIIWKNSKDQILPNANTDNIRVMSDSSLLLQPVSREMSGNYSCLVENVFGRDETVHELVVVSRPKAPDVAVVHATESTIQVQWKANAHDAPFVTGYILNYKTAEDEWKHLYIEPHEHKHTLKDLKCGTHYFISVQTLNFVGKSEVGSLIKATTKGEKPPSPVAEDVLLVGSNSATLLLDSWPTRSCAVRDFSVSYRPAEEESWRLLGDGLSPRGYLSLGDLRPASRYHLRITARSDPGPVLTHIVFATRTVNGEMVPLESMAEPPKSNFFDKTLLIPSVGGTICIFSVVLCLAFMRRRNCPKKTKETKTLMELENQKNNSQQDHAYSPSPAQKGNSSLSVHKGSDTSGPDYEICPYATFAVAPRELEELLHLQTLSREHRGSGAGHHRSRPAAVPVASGSSHRDYQTGRGNAKRGSTSKSPPDGLSLEISCISSQQTLPVEKKEYGEGRLGRLSRLDRGMRGQRRGGAGAPHTGVSSFVSDSESSGPERPFRPHHTPVFKQHTPDSTVFELDSSTESAEMSPELAWRSMVRRGVSSRKRRLEKDLSQDFSIHV